MKVKYFTEDDLLVIKFSDIPYDYAEKIGTFIPTRNTPPVRVGMEHGAPDVTSGRSGFRSAEDRKEGYCGCKAAELHYPLHKKKEPVSLEILNASKFLKEVSQSLTYPLKEKVFF